MSLEGNVMEAIKTTKGIEIDWHDCDYCGGYGIERTAEGNALYISAQEGCDLSIEMHDLDIHIEMCYLCLEKIITHTLGESHRE